MTTTTGGTVSHGNAYNLMILVVTIVSLVLMVMLLLPLSAATKDLLSAYDNVICIVFLADFFINLKRAPSKKGYLIDQRGWLDLLGSIPTIRGFEALGILRLARLSRLERIYRLYRQQNKKDLFDDVLHRRASYAVLITALTASIVLMTASIVVLNAESRSATANITNGWDAFWWACVTITTVGYGDRFPTTVAGRIAAIFVMVMGIGIIGAAASIMASLLVGGSSSGDDAQPTAPPPPAIEQELAGVKSELAALRRLVERLEGGSKQPAE